MQILDKMVYNVRNECMLVHQQLQEGLLV